jgi:lysophospholipase L1-like esterase
MKHTMLLSLLLSFSLLAGENAWEPMPRVKEYGWMSTATWKQRHENNLKRAKEGKIDLLFLGDSITEGWGNNAVWQKNYAPLNAANFGIGGDTTQNVLWRITNGELEGVSPKLVVLMIGTNNFGLHGDTPENVIKGITAIITALKAKTPAAKILLMGIFPRDEKPTSPIRAKIKTVNDSIAKLADEKTIRYIDIGPKLANPDGSLSKEIMPDFLHLSEKGYVIWADEIKTLLAEMMK